MRGRESVVDGGDEDAGAKASEALERCRNKSIEPTPPLSPFADEGLCIRSPPPPLDWYPPADDGATEELRPCTPSMSLFRVSLPLLAAPPPPPAACTTPVRGKVHSRILSFDGVAGAESSPEPDDVDDDDGEGDRAGSEDDEGSMGARSGRVAIFAMCRAGGWESAGEKGERKKGARWRKKGARRRGACGGGRPLCRWSWLSQWQWA